MILFGVHHAGLHTNICRSTDFFLRRGNLIFFKQHLGIAEHKGLTLGELPLKWCGEGFSIIHFARSKSNIEAVTGKRWHAGTSTNNSRHQCTNTPMHLPLLKLYVCLAVSIDTQTGGTFYGWRNMQTNTEARTAVPQCTWPPGMSIHVTYANSSMICRQRCGHCID